MHEKFMKAALALARESKLEGEVPIGAVIVKDGEIIATGRNRREYGKNALYHAEIEAIDNISRIRFMTSHPKDLSEELIEVMFPAVSRCPGG